LFDWFFYFRPVEFQLGQGKLNTFLYFVLFPFDLILKGLFNVLFIGHANGIIGKTNAPDVMGRTIN